MKHVLNVPDDECARKVGIDAFMFLRFLKLFARYAVACSILGGSVLMPMYASEPSRGDSFGIETLTMGNLTQGSTRLWYSLVAVYLYTALFLGLLFKEYKYFVSIRQIYFKRGDKGVPLQTNYSVLVENIPESLRSSEKLFDLFETLFPKEVYSARIFFQFASFISACKDRDHAICALEKAIAYYEAHGRKKGKKVKVVSPASNNRWGEKVTVDAIGHYSALLKKKNDVIEGMASEVKKFDSAAREADGSPWARRTTEKRLAAAGGAAARNLRSVAPAPPLQSDGEPPTAALLTAECVTAAGVVTFRSRAAQARATQLTYLFERFPDIVVSPAPSAIVWENLGASVRYTRFSSALCSGVLYAGLLLWAPLLAVIAAISRLSTLEAHLPFLRGLPPAAKAVLQGQLPVLALMASVAALPRIFTAVATLVEKRKSLYDVHAMVLSWFFLYQLANVYVILVGGSLFGALSRALDEPASLLSMATEALPGVSTFFINYVLSLLLSEVPLSLLDPARLIKYVLFRRIVKEPKTTARALMEGSLAPVGVSYAEEAPQLLYVVCVGLVYSVIAPLLLVVAGLFASAAYAAWKYRFLYVVAPSYESGGEFWYRLYSYSLTGLMCATITIIGYVGLKEGVAQAPLLVPVPVGILLFWRYMDAKFERLSRNMAYSLAREDEDAGLVHGERGEEMDAADPAAAAAPRLSKDFYSPSCLQEPVRRGPFPYRVNNEPLFDAHGCVSRPYRCITRMPEGTLDYSQASPPGAELNESQPAASRAADQPDQPQAVTQRKRNRFEMVMVDAVDDFVENRDQYALEAIEGVVSWQY